MSDAAVVAREIADLKRRLAAVERTGTGGRRSLEGSADEVYDSDGSLRAVVGVQDDGTVGAIAVNAPPPPVPSTPVVTAVMGGLRIAWGGTFADALVAPLDWSRVEVHVSTVSGFVPDSSTLRGTIETPQGAELLVPLSYQTHYARLVSRNTSGTASAASVQAWGIPLQVQDSDIAGVSASKLTIGTLSTGGGITAESGTSGGSLVLDPAGLRLYNPDGMKMVDLHTATGDAELVGHLTGGSIAIAVNDAGVPYYTDFSAVTAGTVPGDWTLISENANPHHTSVVTSGFPAGVTGGKALQIDTAAATANGTWLFRLPVGQPTDVLVEGRFAVSAVGSSVLIADRTYPTMVRQISNAETGFDVRKGDAIWLNEVNGDLGVFAVANDFYQGSLLTDYPPMTASTWYRYEIEVTGSSIYSRVWKDGDPAPARALAVDSRVSAAGYVTVGWHRDTYISTPAPRKVWMDWIRVTPRTVGFRVDTLGQMSAASTATFTSTQATLARIGAADVMDAVPLRVRGEDPATAVAKIKAAAAQSANIVEVLDAAGVFLGGIMADGSAKFGGQAIQDTGWVTGASAFASNGNVTVDATGTRVRKYGSLCVAKLHVTYTGATLTASATGNLADTLIGALAAGFRPTTARTAALFRSSGGTSGGVHLNSAGDVVLTDAHPGSTIAYGDILAIDAVYFTD